MGSEEGCGNKVETCQCSYLKLWKDIDTTNQYIHQYAKDLNGTPTGLELRYLNSGKEKNEK